VDRKSSRLQTQANIKEAREQYETQNAMHAKLKAEAEKQSAKLDTASATLDKQTEKKTHLRRTHSQVAMDHQSLAKAVKIHSSEAERNEKAIAGLHSATDRLKEKLSSLEAEMAADFLHKLSKADEEEMHDSITSLAELKKGVVQLATVRSKVETDKKVIEGLLTTNLLKRKEELEGNLSTSQADENSEQLEKETGDLQALRELSATLKEKLKTVEEGLEDALKKEKARSSDLDKLRSKEQKAADELSTESKATERLLSKRGVYVSKRDDNVRKIRDLGSLPAEAYKDKYKKLNMGQAMKKLNNLGKQLKEFTHVNKKAIDQYVQFTEQRESLLERKKELDKGRQAIIELIEHLDQKKDAAIERTFKGIAKHFSAVFKELVPDGKGMLVMETKRKGKGKGEEGDKESGVMRYKGVQIKVSFTGASGSDQSMIQLSGGQQSVVALSLIFAIQRCDPSPFYLFDEIDSNLDAVHRTSVARMIKSQAKNTQFLTTTFRPEHIATADKFYGVKFQNKLSRVSVLTKEEAKELILVVEREYEADLKKR